MKLDSGLLFWATL